VSAPIAFDPIPVPARQSLVDIPTPAAAQAGVIDANFAKVNTWLQTQPLVSLPYFGRSTGPFSGTWTGGAHIPYPANAWPGFSFIVPDCEGLLAYISAEVNTFNYGFAGVGIQATGPGIANGGVILAVWLNGRQFQSTGTARWLDRSQFTAGQRIDVVPTLYTQFNMNIYTDLGEVGITPWG
jgi:hypothetical protein